MKGKGNIEKVDFNAVYRDQILGNAKKGRLPADGCGAPGCSGGWVTTPRGQARCPKCKAERLAVQYARAGIEGTLFDRTWESLTVQHDSWKLARELGRDIGTVIGEVINVALIGPRGRGKTQAMVMLAKDAVQAGRSALIVDWAEWVDEVQSDYTRKHRTQAEHIADLVSVDLLGLDEVGGAASKDGALERKLFTRVIGARYRAGRPTMLTANMNRVQLEQAMGERAFDRIQHACEWIVFDGPAMRAEVEGSRVQGTLERLRKAAGL